LPFFDVCVKASKIFKKFLFCQKFKTLLNFLLKIGKKIVPKSYPHVKTKIVEK